MLDTNPAQKTMQVYMFGGLRLVVGDVEITSNINRSLKLWNVLCYLIVNRDRLVSQSELIDVFWADDDKSNPASALKTLISRLRNLLESIFTKDLNPIISARSAYRFNPEIKCVLDIESFEELYKKSVDTNINIADKTEFYKKALDLYKGQLLPRISNESWIIPLAVRYSNMYLEIVKGYASILYNSGDYQQMNNICSKANSLAPLDEGINICLIRSMLKLGNVSGALKHYQTATDLLYRNLGVKPCDEFRELYKQILEKGQSIESDLDTLQEELKQHSNQDGVFMCDYSFFKDIYCLETRRNLRNGSCIHIALLTITSTSNNLKILNTAMDNMKTVLDKSLRKGDVVSRYSGSQYVIMLPSANFEDATMVMDRLINTFNEVYKNKLDIKYKIQPMF